MPSIARHGGSGARLLWTTASKADNNGEEMMMKSPSRTARLRGWRLPARLVLAALLAAAALPAAAQQGPPPASSTGASAVFVSRLKAEPVDDQVKLTWTDSPDITGSCVVYRSDQEITSQTLARASVIGTVPTGTGSFIDTPPYQRGWFYAVLLRDSAGTLYPVLVPFRNKTSAPAAPQTAAPEEQLAARVTDIHAVPTAQGDSIEVTFVSSNPTRDLLIFWGPTRFSRPQDLLTATRTTPLDPGTTRYVLAVLPGIDYWFAVLDSGLFKLGQAPLAPGANTTAYPIQLQVTSAHGLPSAFSASQRGIPLPSLAITRGVQSGRSLDAGDIADLPDPAPISDATQKALDALRQELPAPRSQPPQAQVLPSDATPTPGGELGRLQEIVQGPFLAGDMSSAETRLLDFLSLPRKPDLSNRARFYLGQVYYFETRTRDALLEFLSAQDSFYGETQAWIDACYEKLEKSDL
jgi:hypothetical protein